MFRIGIIGTENYHAKEFAGCFNLPNEKGGYTYPDFRVTLVYGHYQEENERLVKEFGAERVAESIEEMLQNVDAVIITARDGKYHAGFARPFIEVGIPAFIDKPFTCDVQQAIELIQLAKVNNVPLCGGSSLKYAEDIQALKTLKSSFSEKVQGGYVSAPLDFESVYSGFWFYASHLAEMCLEIFGWTPKSVLAVENNHNVNAIVEYEGYSVTCNFINHNYAAYSGGVYTAEQNEVRFVRLDNAFRLECEAFVEMVRTGKMPHSYEELMTPVLFLKAVKDSFETGEKVAIKQNA